MKKTRKSKLAFFCFEKFELKCLNGEKLANINSPCDCGYCHKPFEVLIIPLWMDAIACENVCVSVSHKT